MRVITTLKHSTQHEGLDQFRQSFYTYYQDLHRYAYTLLRDNDEARDVVQDVFLKYWKKEKSMNDAAFAKQYLYRAVFNTCMNRVRHEKVRLRYLQQRAHATITTSLPVIEKELAGKIDQAIAGLPAQCRIVFLKSRDEGKKYTEIASELDISVKTVEAQIAKALRILRQELADYLVSILIMIIPCMY